jgi:hypothetical protein
LTCSRTSQCERALILHVAARAHAHILHFGKVQQALGLELFEFLVLLGQNRGKVLTIRRRCGRLCRKEATHGLHARARKHLRGTRDAQQGRQAEHGGRKSGGRGRWNARGSIVAQRTGRRGTNATNETAAERTRKRTKNIPELGRNSSRFHLRHAHTLASPQDNAVALWCHCSPYAFVSAILSAVIN